MHLELYMISCSWSHAIVPMRTHKFHQNKTQEKGRVLFLHSYECMLGFTYFDHLGPKVFQILEFSGF